MKHVAYKNDDWDLFPDPNYANYKGSKLKIFFDQHELANCFDEEMVKVFEVNQTKFGAFRFEEDGGRITRANIPFMNPPSAPTYIPRSNLPIALQEDINSIVSEYHLKPEDAKATLRNLIHPYLLVMSNLPGGVHNCGEKTLIEMVKKLELDPSHSVLLECGSGAPILGLQASIFTKQTICIDLDDVMKTVYSILENMGEDSSSFMNTIHMIAGFSSS